MLSLKNIKKITNLKKKKFLKKYKKNKYILVFDPENINTIEMYKKAK